MWVFLNNAFLSIVSAGARNVTVRARFKGDIERAFDRLNFTPTVLETPARDYPYRAVVTRDLVARMVFEHAANIDYHNFKDSVAKPDVRRHNAYLAVWAAMQSRGDKPARRSWLNPAERYAGASRFFEDAGIPFPKGESDYGDTDERMFREQDDAAARQIERGLKKRAKKKRAAMLSKRGR